MSQILEVKNISELIDEKFFIPKYQRGYRWDKTQVEALLKDITENESTKKYCLQPIVVSEMPDGKWELLDGQQRLTTIFILICYMKKYRPSIGSFSLEFETREKSKNFLEGLEQDMEIDKSNIDFYYITSAMKYIGEWFSNYSNQQENEVFKFSQKLLDDVQILWYNIGEGTSEEDKIKIFTRLNIGKIPLTSAELIKALFLNDKNFVENLSEKESSLKYIQQKQFEIASEWDQIENNLHDTSFWYFICKNSTNYSTRIELLFELILQDNKPKNADPLWTFLKIQENFQAEDVKAVKEVNDQWRKIKKIYHVLKEWYSNHKLYHYVGYLITIGKSLKIILQKYTESTKKEFEKYIINEIANSIKDIDVEQLSFDQNSDKNKITNILLLHNIQTIVSSNSDIRFLYDKYHQEKWSLEHIHAQNSEELRTEKQWEDWLDYHKSYLGEDFIMPNKITKDKFNDLVNNVYEKYNEDKSSSNVDHSIYNLALLLSKDNSALSNSIFPVKRNKLIERDKEGRFIPLCTKNAFLKYYSSSDDQQLSFWSDDDKISYGKDIKDTMKYFLGDKNE